jgi:hypothetical protein
LAAGANDDAWTRLVRQVEGYRASRPVGRPPETTEEERRQKRRRALGGPGSVEGARR